MRRRKPMQPLRRRAARRVSITWITVRSTRPSMTFSSSTASERSIMGECGAEAWATGRPKKEQARTSSAVTSMSRWNAGPFLRRLEGLQTSWFVALPSMKNSTARRSPSQLVFPTTAGVTSQNGTTQSRVWSVGVKVPQVGAVSSRSRPPMDDSTQDTSVPAAMAMAMPKSEKNMRIPGERYRLRRNSFRTVAAQAVNRSRTMENTRTSGSKFPVEKYLIACLNASAKKRVETRASNTFSLKAVKYRITNDKSVTATMNRMRAVQMPTHE
mmetsp:Transcript_1410/g.3150  ORF Transcript_1410/g.3150 Transcript_1410/m.3150 type:complete len:270 (+) Transcript_1410:815-1624(+)